MSAWEQKPHVVIVGGGFGGLYAARSLARAPVRVTVVDRRNHHLFQPLLYQVATAALSPADIAAPIRHVLRRQRNARVLLGEVAGIDPAPRRVRLSTGEHMDYDYLVLAAGAVDQYFGNDDWAIVAPGLKRLEDATEIRRRFLLAFERAEHESAADACRELLTFVVVGGGPTGVEMAGAFAEVARHTLAGGDFRRIDPATARIILVEGGPRVLATYPEALSRKAQQQLERLGVEVRTGAMVTRIDPGAVWLGDERIPTRNVVWAAGVAASPLGALLGAPTDRIGRVMVEPDLSVPGHPEVFVIGDLASFPHQTGEPLPGIAPVAIQQGKAAARNIRLTLAGKPRRQFRYRDRGSLATIGRGAAVGLIAGRMVSGALAWFVWLFIHLMYLVGFRNRVSVLMEWAWSYLTWQRGARLITGDHAWEPAAAAAERATRSLEGADAAPDPEAAADSGGWLEGDPDQARSAADSGGWLQGDPDQARSAADSAPPKGRRTATARPSDRAEPG